MTKHTPEQWQAIAREFAKAQPSSPVWFALVDAVITYLLDDRITETLKIEALEARIDQHEQDWYNAQPKPGDPR